MKKSKIIERWLGLELADFVPETQMDEMMMDSQPKTAANGEDISTKNNGKTCRVSYRETLTGGVSQMNEND